MAILRPAREDDLGHVYAVWYRTETLDSPNPPAPGAPPAYLRHVLQTGTLIVAEEAGKIRGFAGAITRGDVAFLTDLFVDPDWQSGGLGKALLEAAMSPVSGLTRCTVSSRDPRALALYIRSGMRPQWPVFALGRSQSTSPSRLEAPGDIEISIADATDPQLLTWDNRISGRLRAAELAFWIREQQAIPLWLRRQGRMIGYAWVRLNAGTLDDPRACAVGPVGADVPEHAAECALAAVTWAAQRADILSIEIPGPHACLPLLLERGFHILYADTFVSTVSFPFFDPRCYIPSGGDLF